MYTNADCLLNKISELNSLIQNKEYDIIAITETFPKFKTNVIDYNSAEWCIKGYNMFHCQDKGLTERGCIIYTNNRLKTFQLDNTNNRFIETVTIGISCSHVPIEVPMRTTLK